MSELRNLELILLVGMYAQKWHLGKNSIPVAAKTLTQTVENWRDYGPRYLPTPHPSWRNSGWLKKNPWFEAELLPVMRKRVKELL